MQRQNVFLQGDGGFDGRGGMCSQRPEFELGKGFYSRCPFNLLQLALEGSITFITVRLGFFQSRLLVNRDRAKAGSSVRQSGKII